MTKASHIVACMLLVLLFAGVESSRADTTVVWQLFSGGGANVSNNDYRLKGSLRQTAIRFTESGSYDLENGFWPYIRTLPCCIQIRGNVDGDLQESVDVADVTYLSDYLFRGGPAPSCEEEADVNASGGVDVADLTYLSDYLFQSGPAPLACP